MEYITKQDIRDRAELLGYVPSYNPMSDDYERMAEEAEAQLVEEHIQQIFEWHDEALEALINEPNADEIAWLLLKGMGELDIDVVGHNEFYFHKWTIRPHPIQGWGFWDGNSEINPEDEPDMEDPDLLQGLLNCEKADKALSRLRLDLAADLRPIQRIKLDRIIKAAKAEGRWCAMSETAMEVKSA